MFDIYEKLDDTSEDYVEHEGVKRESGRYEWGSGINPFQHEPWYQGYLGLKKSGMTEKEIAESMGMTQNELRKRVATTRNREEKIKMDVVRHLSESGMSKSEIGRQFGVNESVIRDILKRSDAVAAAGKTVHDATKDAIKENLSAIDGYLDIGKGTEHYLGVKSTRLNSVIQDLVENEGYVELTFKKKQMGSDHSTTYKVLAPPGTDPDEARKKFFADPTIVKAIDVHSEDGGFTFKTPEPPNNVSSDRVFVRYGNEGGKAKDGTIELRRNVPDLNLGQAHYAQVRIGVDGTHFLKGVAIYSDDIPDGYDIVYNTNKDSSVPKHEVFKKQKDDPNSPFGSSVKTDSQLRLIQRHYTDQDGKEHLSALNIVNEEGSIGAWSVNLASQFLSKQSTTLIRKQLNKSLDQFNDEYEEIMSITNPTIQRSRLEKFAEECDSASVHLKAAAMPRQSTKMIVPDPSLKSTEVYAPGYEDGEEVVLVRYPHAGIFEIPRLVVNNRKRTSKKIIGSDAIDAICINSEVAEQLSGADFDGDTVIVIPTKGQNIKTQKAVKELIDFDAKVEYARPKGTTPYWAKGSRQEGIEMGKISNLITDMTLQEAPLEDMIKAVKHSQVVIDTGKHNLDARRSYVENGIAGLNKKYRGSTTKGASTLISKAKSDVEISDPRGQRIGYTIDRETGEKKWLYEKSYYKDKKTGEYKLRQSRSTAMAEAKDARELSSGHPKEELYAEYANNLKALANKCRLQTLSIADLPSSKDAAKVFEKEVASLQKKLVDAEKSKPKERQAQLIGSKLLNMAVTDNPELLEDSATYKKHKARCLNLAREAIGSKRPSIYITDAEWEAIQNGAVKKTTLKSILNYADDGRVRELSTPKQRSVMAPYRIEMAKRLLAAGNTTKEVADRLGVSTTVLMNNLYPNG